MVSDRRVFLTMADGVRLNATLYQPEGDGPWPAIVEALPYRKDDDTAAYRPEYERLAESGYVVCRVDVRGTGSSEGVAEDEYTAAERRDLLEVIDWLATREWSSGNVGMYGTSYSGFNSIHLAMERPRALKAIIPIFATDDRYADDVHYFGGALKQLDLLDYPTYMIALNALPPVPGVYGQGWREEWERRVEATEPWLLTWMAHQRYDDYWRFGSLREDYGSIQAATMIVAGWADGYTNNSLRTLEALRCPRRAIIGPWAHASTDTSLPGPNADLVPEMLRWWDRWLKGVDNGIDREPEVVVFVRRSTKIEPRSKEIRGEWRYEPAWPVDRLAERALKLEKAAGPASDELVVRGDVGWTAWISCAGHMPWGQPDDQRADEAFSLVYDWEPLESELEILGHPVLDVSVQSTAPVAYVSAKLCDVFPDGYSSLVTRGMLNLAHRDSREHPSPVEPGTTYRVRLELEVTSWVFEAGHRIRLDLAGADWPNAWAPPGPATITFHRADSTLTLPVLDGLAPVQERPVMPSPQKADAAIPNRGHDDYLWRIERDLIAGETRAVVGNWGDYPANGDVPSFAESYGGVVSVSAADPGVARAEGETRYEMRFPEATVRSHATTTVESDRDEYRVRIVLRVSENGAERWVRRWDRTFPRDLQ